jgi:hypothetical protein
MRVQSSNLCVRLLSSLHVRSCKFCCSGKGEVHQIDSFKILATKVSSHVCIFPVDNSLTVVVDSGWTSYVIWCWTIPRDIIFLDGEPHSTWFWCSWSSLYLQDWLSSCKLFQPIFRYIMIPGNNLRFLIARFQGHGSRVHRCLFTVRVNFESRG